MTRRLVLVLLLASTSSAAAQEAEDPDTAALAEEAAPDEVERVRGALASLGLDEVRVREEAGVLHLEGQVAAPREREAAETIARGAGDWLFVANDVEVRVAEDEAAPSDPDRALEGQLRQVFANVAELSAVRVDSTGGVVHLRGSVPSDAAMERAVGFASERDGVLYVDSELEVDQAVDTRVESTWTRLSRRVEQLAARLPLYGIALAIVALFWFLGSLIRGRSKRRKNPLLRNIGRQLLGALVLLAGLAIALDLLEATAILGAVLGTAGVVGLAVGFAFKDIIENYLASVLLAVRRPFAPGEHVQIGGHEGKVVRLTSRDTVLMTLDGNHLRLPNAEVFKSVTTNFTLNPRRRFLFTVGVGVAEDLTAMQQVVTRTLHEMEGVLGDPEPFTRVLELADFTVTVEVYGWVDQRDYDFGKVRSEAIRRVKVALDEAGVDMPYPTQVVVQAEAAPEKPAPVSDVPAHDLQADHDLDKQVEEDRERSEETDLLAASE